MNNLILLANEFPYGNWEPYLKTEVKYYNRFDQVYICSLQLRKEHKKIKRTLPLKNIKVCEVDKAPAWIYLLYSVKALMDINLYQEIKKLILRKKFTIKRFVKLMVFLSRSHYESDIILKFLKKEKLLKNQVNNERINKGYIYSYRFEYQPYLGLLLAKHMCGYKVISRAHRFDLYEERRDVSYIPMREYLLSKLCRVILIAEDGKNYLIKKYPAYKNKLEVSRLGTLDYSIVNTKSPQGKINLVSCSTISSVKRINLIVKALAQLKNVDVNWTHYGEGVQRQEIMSMCERELPSNINYYFRGYIDNDELMKEYLSNSYHLFLNVSSSEGIPVSIMEALSFGIPCIATDVGGTSEIIKDKYNGILLKKEFSLDELEKWIIYFANMSEEEYQKFRHHARQSWQENYNADRNYSDFIATLV